MSKSVQTEEESSEGDWRQEVFHYKFQHLPFIWTAPCVKRRASGSPQTHQAPEPRHMPGVSCSGPKAGAAAAQDRQKAWSPPTTSSLPGTWCEVPTPTSTAQEVKVGILHFYVALHINWTAAPEETGRGESFLQHWKLNKYMSVCAKWHKSHGEQFIMLIKIINAFIL